MPPPVSSVVPGLPVDVDHVLTLGLAKSPSERYARAPLLARDLRLAARSVLDERSRARARRLSPEATDNVTTQAVVRAGMAAAGSGAVGVAAVPRLPPLPWPGSGDRETRRRRRR